MNTEYLLDAIGLLDDDLIQEAETCSAPKRRSGYRSWMSLAACLAVVVVLGYGLTHIRLDSSTKTGGVIMCDQARMLDLNSRRAAFEEKAPAAIVAEAVDLIHSFIEI